MLFVVARARFLARSALAVLDDGAGKASELANGLRPGVSDGLSVVLLAIVVAFRVPGRELEAIRMVGVTSWPRRPRRCRSSCEMENELLKLEFIVVMVG